jgi:hypothetical protein
MTTEGLEKKIAAMERQIKSLENEVARNTAAVECSRLLNRFCYLNNQHVKKEHPPITSMFAMKTPGVSVQLGQLGVWEGPEAVKKVYGQKRMFVPEGGPEVQQRSMPAGLIFLHPLASIYIEVAKDLQTAKSVCLSIGIESTRGGNDNPMPCWSWGAYGVDFIKEDGEWKIWHFHIYRIFRASQGWTTADPDVEGGPPLDDVNKPTRPGKDDYPYRANEEYIFKPDPPEPYSTFDTDTAYC